jgi:hypothetical protein
MMKIDFLLGEAAFQTDIPLNGQSVPFIFALMDTPGIKEILYYLTSKPIFFFEETRFKQALWSRYYSNRFSARVPLIFLVAKYYAQVLFAFLVSYPAYKKQLNESAWRDDTLIENKSVSLVHALFDRPSGESLQDTDVAIHVFEMLALDDKHQLNKKLVDHFKKFCDMVRSPSAFDPSTYTLIKDFLIFIFTKPPSMECLINTCGFSLFKLCDTETILHHLLDFDGSLHVFYFLSCQKAILGVIYDLIMKLSDQERSVFFRRFYEVLIFPVIIGELKLDRRINALNCLLATAHGVDFLCCLVQRNPEFEAMFKADDFKEINATSSGDSSKNLLLNALKFEQNNLTLQSAFAENKEVKAYFVKLKASKEPNYEVSSLGLFSGHTSSDEEDTLVVENTFSYD